MSAFGKRMVSVAEASEPGGPLGRLLRETIIPNAEQLAHAQIAGDIAVVVHGTPDTLGRQALKALGWRGGTVFAINRSRARRHLSPSDEVTARWVERRDPDELRMLVVWGSGTLLVNFRSGEGYSIEAGSLDADREGLGSSGGFGRVTIGDA